MTNNNMKLITEYVDFDELEVFTESTEDGTKKNLKIKGPFMGAEIKNRNGRIYPRELLEREVARFTMEKIDKKRAMGELDHPPVPQLNLDRVSHLIESLEMEGNKVIGVAKILDTPMGNIAKSLIESGVNLGTSSRGIGTLKGNTVNPDFKLLTVDIVGDPSYTEAYVEGILENKEYIIQGNDIIEVAVSNLKTNLDNHGSSIIKEALDDFLTELRNNL
jgi:hypothetical protein